jgi:peptidoglycan/xylan/chitin deacetylase (PgdA/CDA1 family)
MRGIFSLSVDVELAWGSVHKNRISVNKLREISANVRKIIDEVFALLENYEVPATWNILGHLVLDGCSRESPKRLPHSDMPRPDYTWLSGDWYKYDPCTNVTKDPAWYGRDIVSRIVYYTRKSKVGHEIGCHSFSHQQFGDPKCTEELAGSEIAKCIELLKTQFNTIPRTFAFPRDYVGHLNTLKEHGITTFRDAPPKLYPCLKLEKTFSNYLKTKFSLVHQLISYYILFPPHVVTPKEVLPGLWGTPGCLAYGNKPLIPLRLVTIKAIQGVNRAIREGKVFSMYTHLKEFGANRHMIMELEKVLSYASKKRSQNKLELKTMRQLKGE